MLVRFAEQEGIEIAQQFIETESGKHDDSRRPQLKAALEVARKLKAPILVASSIGCLVMWSISLAS